MAPHLRAALASYSVALPCTCSPSESQLTKVFELNYFFIFIKYIFQNWREPSPGLSCDQNRPVSLNPVEMGVVWSRSGPIASGTLITGVAAGLKPKVVVWPSNEPVKR